MQQCNVQWQRSQWVMATVAMLAAGSARAVELDSLPEEAVDVLTTQPAGLAEPHFLSGHVGVGVFSTGRFVGADERVTFPLPVVYFNYNDRLYWSITSFGGWLWHSDDRRFKWGLMAKARGGVKGEYTGYTGIDDRDPSIDAGINMVWNSRPVTIGLSWFGDIGGRSNGQSASLRFSKPFRLGERWSTTPSLVADWMDDKLVDYYFGVSPSETSGGAPLYQGKSSLNLRAAWSLSYRMTKQWTLSGGLSYTKLGDGLADSPFTVRDNNTLLFFTASWSFLHIGE